jgi:gliding motility-associated-like protein
MKKHLLLKFTFLLLLCNQVLNAQFQNGLWTGKQANNWFFGQGTGLNFNVIPAESQTGELITDEGSAAISDAAGNLLFYTDGMTIWNRNHQIMLNGQDLRANTSTTQAALVVPYPRNNNLYYVFALDYFAGSNGLTYSIVDMELDGGLGGVTDVKNRELLTSEGQRLASEKMTAVHHEDGEKVWLISTTGGLFNPSNTFNAYLISDTGINTTPVTSEAGLIDAYGVGQLKASPNGSKLVLGAGLYGVSVVCEVLDFDKRTGVVSNPLDLTSAFTSSAYGIEFSPNSKYLYTTDLDLGVVKQFDISLNTQSEILESEVILYTNTDINYLQEYGSLQLAPDGKIYMANYLMESISVISTPNNKGLASGFGFRGQGEDISLKERYSFLGLPGFLQSYFESGILHEGDCANGAVTFSTIRIADIESITWNFGDTASGNNNISTDLTPSHIFTSPGTYRVTATIISNGAEQTTETDVIITAPSAVIPQVPALCADANGNAIFNLNQLTGGILNGQDAAVFSVAYFATATDVASNTPIANPDNFAISGQDIYAQVTNSTNGCKTSIQFNLPVNPLPTALNPADLGQCGIAGTATFNLTTQDVAILGAQDAHNYSVVYFASPADVQANNPISNPANFTTSAQQVYAVVTNTATGCSSSAVVFNLIVTGAAIVAAPLQLKGCSPVNLAAVATQMEANVNLSFYANEQDAVTAVNAIAELFAFTGNNAMVYVRAENTSGCAEIYKVNIQAGDCTIPRGISPNNDGLNDSFDLSAYDVKQLSIYNRYGQQVYSRNNYNSEWHGQADNDNELPTGTYYYFVEQGSGEQKTGWVYVNREAN